MSNARFAAMVAHFGARGGARSTAPSRRRRAERAAGRAGAHPRRGRGGGARRGEPHRADRHAARAPSGSAMPMILATSAVHSWLTRKGLRTFTSLNVRSGECIDPHYFAVLIGVGRDDGERLPGAGFDRRPDRARADRGHADRGGGALPRGDRPGAAEDHLEDGDRGDLVLSRRAELRGGGASAGRWWRSISPACCRRISGIGITGVQRQVEGMHALGLARRRRGAADRRLLQGAALGREPRLGGAGDAYPAVGLRPGVIRHLEAVFQGDAGAAADPSARPARLPAEGGAGAARPGRVRSPRSASAS